MGFYLADPRRPPSPFYLDFRLLQSYPESAKHIAVMIFAEMIRGYPCNFLAGVPTAILPVVSSLSDRTSIPMITPRTDRKSHGTGTTIDGAWFKGTTALGFDDLITGAYSKLEAITILRDKGVQIKDIFVLVDREQGGAAALATEGVTLHAAFTISELLELYRDIGSMSLELYQEIRTYLATQST
ncbi:MAG: hypothetical protein AAB782_02095 [Patescibacteria group bacterium]